LSRLSIQGRLSLTLLAKALVIATADWSDGKTVDDLLNELVDKHRRAPE
jgi:hypothetical protein